MSLIEPLPRRQWGYCAICVKTAITEMIELGVACGVAKSGCKPSFGQIAKGVYLDLLEFFPPLITTHFGNIIDHKSKVSFDDVFEFSQRCRDIIRQINLPIRNLAEKHAENDAKILKEKAYEKALMAWCSEAQTCIENFDLEKRLDGKQLTSNEKKILPELAKFFEIFYRQEGDGRHTTW